MTSFTPPLGERCEISNSVRTSNLAWLPPIVHSNYSEAVCLAARTFAIAFLRSVVIFVRYREVSTRTILPNFIGHCRETALYSRFGAGVGKRGRKRNRRSGKFWIASIRIPLAGWNKGTFDNFFWPGGLHQVGGSAWARLVANGPPISISTWWMLSVRHPRWILGILAVLAAEKEVPPGQVEAFAPTAIALPNLV